MVPVIERRGCDRAHVSSDGCGPRLITLALALHRRPSADTELPKIHNPNYDYGNLERTHVKMQVQRPPFGGQKKFDLPAFFTQFDAHEAQQCIMKSTLSNDAMPGRWKTAGLKRSSRLMS